MRHERACVVYLGDDVLSTGANAKLKDAAAAPLLPELRALHCGVERTFLVVVGGSGDESCGCDGILLVKPD